MLANKRDYTIEREARREDTRRKRKERVMCAYVKHAHPTVYKEMCNIYEDLNGRYPNTRDLRKTTHFINLKKKIEKEKKPSRKNTREFTLKIPLRRATTTSPLPSPPAVLPSTPVASSPPAVLPPTPVASSPPAVLPSTPVASSPPAVLPSTPVASSPPAVLPSTPVASSPPAVLPSTPVASSPPAVLPPAPTASSPLHVLPPIPTDLYQTLLEELQQDPDLWQIFNNFPIQEMDTHVAQDMDDINDISPLEVELN